MQSATKAILAALLLATSAGVFPLVSPAAATSFDLVEAYNQETDSDFREGLQVRLAWTGDYRGPFSGVIDARTLRAIRDFQARHGEQADGIITEALLQRLVSESDHVQNRLDATLVGDAETGTLMLLPEALVAEATKTELGRVWHGREDRFEVETVRMNETGHDLRSLFEALSQPNANRSVSDAEFAGDWFKLRGERDGVAYFMKFAGRGEDLRGFTISFEPEAADEYEPFVAVASNLFEPFHSEPQNPLLAEDRNGPFSDVLARYRQANADGAGRRYAMANVDPQQPNLFELPADPNLPQDEKLFGAEPDFAMAGTGFVVGNDGWLLTNAHVVEGCGTVRIGTQWTAREVILDEASDLALLHVPGVAGEPLPVSQAKPRLGEDVLALGYPLRSILADSLNVTRGNVSSLLGLMNDPRHLQISAAVQPGNSGGPLIDLSGTVVGVVTAKLNAVAVADATGDIPQSINFAIQPERSLTFLEEHGIDYAVARDGVAPASVPDATASAMGSVHPVICER